MSKEFNEFLKRFPYDLSLDYELLWMLVLEKRMVIFGIKEPADTIKILKKKGEVFIESHVSDLGAVKEKGDFIELCQKLEFYYVLPANEKIR